MEAPLVVSVDSQYYSFVSHVNINYVRLLLQSEVYDDPSTVQAPQFPYQHTPQVFLFSRPMTKHLDLDTATALAWRLRGLAQLLLVHRYIYVYID